MHVTAAADEGLFRFAVVGPRISRRNFLHDVIGFNFPRKLLGVCLAREPLKGDLDESGVGHVLLPVGEDKLHALGEGVKVLGRVVFPRRYGEMLHDVQKLNNVGSSAGCGRGGIDGIASVGSVNGLLFDEAVILQVLHGHGAAVLVHRSDHGLADGSVIEGIGAVGSKKMECLRQFRLLENDILFGRKSAWKPGSVGAVLAELVECVRDDLLLHGVDGEALFGKTDGRSGHLGEGHGSVFIQHCEDSLHDSRNAYGLAAEHGFLRRLRSFGSVHVLR